MAENKKQPADIIFAIDNSGSMDFEEGQVQQNMNTFSTKIIQSGIDAHVVLISNDNICIAKPLGSGSCPTDTNLPTYLHVQQGVGSNDALAKILSTYDMWKDMMRPDGAKHVVVVSDDNASGVNANAFDSMFKALGPSYVDYQFHAIVGTWDVGDVLKCAADPVCCATIADEGKEYKSLVAKTGGVLGPLCEGGKQKFDELFTKLSTEVIQEATIACEWTIPEPMGMDIDFGKVNVDYLDGKGGVQVVPKVMDMASCGNLEAWYYDDPMMPTKIYACPALCMKIQGNPDAKGVRGEGHPKPSRFTVWWAIIHSSLVGTTSTSILLSRAWMRVACRWLAAGYRLRPVQPSHSAMRARTGAACSPMPPVKAMASSPPIAAIRLPA